MCLKELMTGKGTMDKWFIKVYCNFCCMRSKLSSTELCSPTLIIRYNVSDLLHKYCSLWFSVGTELNCSFDYGFCKWNDDLNNWKLKWKQTSLKLIGFGNENEENNAACLRYPEDAFDETLTARLWGPEVSRKVKLGCFAFQYRIFGDSSTKLTLMRREMGYVNWDNFKLSFNYFFKVIHLYPK